MKMSTYQYYLANPPKPELVLWNLDKPIESQPEVDDVEYGEWDEDPSKDKWPHMGRRHRLHPAG
jgi:hypothetical protein